MMYRAPALVDLTGNDIDPPRYFQTYVPVITEPVILATHSGPMIVTPKSEKKNIVGPILGRLQEEGTREHNILMGTAHAAMAVPDVDLPLRCANPEQCVLATKEHSTKQVCVPLVDADLCPISSCPSTMCPSTMCPIIFVSH